MLAFTAIALYFSYHMLSGDNGILAMIQLQQHVKSANEQLVLVEVENMQLQHRVNMMYSNSMDKDLLDEQVRRFLGHANSKEIILINE